MNLLCTADGLPSCCDSEDILDSISSISNHATAVLGVRVSQVCGAIGDGWKLLCVMLRKKTNQNSMLSSYIL